MAGWVQVPLTDHELDTLLEWYEAVRVWDGNDAADDRLAEQLRKYQTAIACEHGGRCSV